MKSTLRFLIVVLAVGVAFLAGRSLDVLEAQGRDGPARNQPPAADPVSIPRESELLPYEPGDSAGSAANGYLAVTGSYGVGTSVLYLIDTNTKQLAVYEARGGSKSMRRLMLVGARRIDLDLQLEGYNDESEYDYEGLRRLFDRRRDAEAAGVEPPSTGGIGDRR